MEIDMGNWAIIITGCGAHHNKKHSKDANRMAADFVQQLRDAGQQVETATFHHSGVDYVDAGSKYNETRDEIER